MTAYSTRTDDTPPDDAVLRIEVGENLGTSAERALLAMEAVQSGSPWAPYFGVSFPEVGQMLAVFTPKRWELIAALRESGPLSIAALARALGRDYRNVHGDVTALAEWMAVRRRADGLVCVPWREIVVNMHLPQQRAA